MATKNTISVDVDGGTSAEAAYNNALTANNIAGNAPSADNYTFVGWVDEQGNDVVLANTIINSNKTFTAKYTYNASFAISWNATPIGVSVYQIYDSTTNTYLAINPTELGTANVGNGDTIVISLIGQTGYSTPTLQINGSSVELVSRQYTFVVTQATASNAIGGTANSYSLSYTASTTGISSYSVKKNGNAISSGGTFIAGDTLSATATPSSNYSISYSWKNASGEVISTAQSISAPAGNVSLAITAASTIQSVLVTPSVGSDGKTLVVSSSYTASTAITVSGTYTTTTGSSGTIAVTIASGSSSGSSSAISAIISNIQSLTVSPSSYGSQVYTVSPTSVSNVQRTVSYNSNGGSGSMSSQNVLSGDSIILQTNAFTPPTNKGFAGWGTTPVVAKYDAGSSLIITKNTIIYAIWSDIA